MTQSTKPKPGKFAELPRSQRNRVRTVSRDAWLESGGKADLATAVADDRVRLVAGAGYLRIAATLSRELICYWSANRIFEPESIFVPGEPSCEGDE